MRENLAVKVRHSDYRRNRKKKNFCDKSFMLSGEWAMVAKLVIWRCKVDILIVCVIFDGDISRSLLTVRREILLSLFEFVTVTLL